MTDKGDAKGKIYEVPSDVARRAHVDAVKYQSMYDASLSDPDAFWGEHAKSLDWIKPFSIVKNTSYAPKAVSIKWFEDGERCF